MKKEKNKSLWDDRRVTIPLSLLIALVLWMVVTLVINPNSTQVLSNVPVDFSYNSVGYTAQQLDIVNNPDVKVKLQLSGNGYEVNKAKSSDFVVYPDYSMVTSAGETELPLRVKVLNSSLNITATVMSPERVSIVFDKVEEKTFKIQVEASNLTIADGYIMQGTVASPSTVTVRGPASEVDQISAVVAKIQPSSDLENMSESKLKTVELTPVDADGNSLKLQYATMDNKVAEVTINIYQTKELPLKINFINEPENFDESSLKYTLSQQTMVVTGTPETLANLSELAVSDFDLSTFELNKSYSLNVNLPRGVESKDNIKTITLSFDTSNMTTRTINVSELRVINAPDNYDVAVNSKRITNVTLVGPKEELENLSPKSVVATIDASQSQVTAGNENLSVSISVPSSSTIFAVGSYSAECSITVKSGS